MSRHVSPHVVLGRVGQLCRIVQRGQVVAGSVTEAAVELRSRLIMVGGFGWRGWR